MEAASGEIFGVTRSTSGANSQRLERTIRMGKTAYGASCSSMARTGGVSRLLNGGLFFILQIKAARSSTGLCFGGV